MKDETTVHAFDRACTVTTGCRPDKREGFTQCIILRKMLLYMKHIKLQIEDKKENSEETNVMKEPVIVNYFYQEKIKKPARLEGKDYA